MERTTEVTQKLVLTPDSLGSNIRDVILEKLQGKYMGACNSKYGYIKSVERILSYSNEPVSSVNFCPVVRVTFEIRILKPEVGMRVEGTVSSLRGECILILVQGKIKALINSENLKSSGFVYDKIGVRYKSKGGSILSQDTISFEIYKVRETDQVCLGKNVVLIKEEAPARVGPIKKASARK